MLALKIHISIECKKALYELGGWIIERRGIIDVKVCMGVVYRARIGILYTTYRNTPMRSPMCKLLLAYGCLRV